MGDERTTSVTHLKCELDPGDVGTITVTITRGYNRRQGSVDAADMPPWASEALLNWVKAAVE